MIYTTIEGWNTGERQRAGADVDLLSNPCFTELISIEMFPGLMKLRILLLVIAYAPWMYLYVMNLIELIFCYIFFLPFPKVPENIETIEVSPAPWWQNPCVTCLHKMEHGNLSSPMKLRNILSKWAFVCGFFFALWGWFYSDFHTERLL